MWNQAGLNQETRGIITITRGFHLDNIYLFLKKSMNAWYISMPWKVSIPAAVNEKKPIMKKRIHIVFSSLFVIFSLQAGRMDYIVGLMKNWNEVDKVSGVGTRKDSMKGDYDQ